MPVPLGRQNAADRQGLHPFDARNAVLDRLSRQVGHVSHLQQSRDLAILMTTALLPELKHGGRAVLDSTTMAGR
ncbi:MAG: hypothetical protein KF726_23995 [Anaerolineae bacterium]|nr:hypothetical protein [Anaerolineae bacterium]